jgi:hypothetical protein
MAVKIVFQEESNAYSNVFTRDYTALSTDTKPTPADLDDESTLVELDTRRAWRYSTTNVNAETGNGWWQI